MPPSDELLALTAKAQRIASNHPAIMINALDDDSGFIMEFDPQIDFQVSIIGLVYSVCQQLGLSGPDVADTLSCSGGAMSYSLTFNTDRLLGEPV